MSAISLQKIATLIGASLTSNSGHIDITGLASLHSATSNDVSFFESMRLKEHLLKTKAMAVIISSEHAALYNGIALVVDNPRLALAQVSQLFTYTPRSNTDIVPPLIGEGCVIAETAHIAPGVCIGAHVTIGEHVRIDAGCVIEDHVTIGAHSILRPNVSVMHHSQIGKQCIVHSGTVIGSDGLGFAFSEQQWHKIAHLGNVIIGDQVEIGANTTIDRGTLDATIIADGVKLDNQIQVAHNVHIGASTIIAAGVSIAGGAKIGKCCQIGGGSLISGHLVITDGVILAGGSGVPKSIKEPGAYASGIPIMPMREWRKNVICFKRLHAKLKNLQQLVGGPS